MTLKNPSMNFYDSDFYDSRNESTVLDFSDFLNMAFIASPNKSISCVLDDSSLTSLAEIPEYKDGNEDITKVPDTERNKLEENNRKKDELFCQEDNLNITEEPFSSSLESDLKSYSLPRYLDVNEKYWVSSSKRNRKSRFDEVASEIEDIQFSEISETKDLLKEREEINECIFASTFQGESPQISQKYDNGKIQKLSFSKMDEESEKIAPKIKASISRSDYIYHELSTIPEVDSEFMDESLSDFDQSDCLSKHDSQNSKNLIANDSFDFGIKAKTVPKFPTYVMKVIQNEHFEKLLQEPGILEASDLTLISTDFDSLSKISDISTRKRHCHSYYKIKGFDDDETPSLISFLQHESSCMRDCID